MTGVFNVKKLAIWHTIAPTYSATTAIIMDMLPWTAQIKIPPSGTQAHCRTNTNDRHDRSSSRCHSHTRRSHHDYKDRSRLVAPNLTPITIDIGVVATRTPTEVTPGHSTDLPTIVSHITGAQVPTATTMTCCTADLRLIGILPEMTADLDINPKNNTTDWPADPHPPCKYHRQAIPGLK